MKLYRVENHSSREIRLDDDKGTVIPPHGSVILDKVQPSFNVKFLVVKSFDAVDSARELGQLQHKLDKAELQNEMLAKANKQLRDEVARMERVLHMLERQQSVMLSSAPAQVGKAPVIPDTPLKSSQFKPTPDLADTSNVKAHIVDSSRGSSNIAKKRKKLSEMTKKAKEN